METPIAPKVHSDYLNRVVDVSNLPFITRQLKTSILESGILDFKAIAFRGMSGALVAPFLALRMGKGIMVCRKPTEHAHGFALEGYCGGGNYIIVDDFCSSGHTVRSIIAVADSFSIGDDGTRSPEGITLGWCYQKPDIPFIPVGIFLYNRKDKAVFTSEKYGKIPIFGIPSGEYECTNRG